MFTIGLGLVLGLDFSVWLVSCYAHVFVRLQVVIVTLLLGTTLDTSVWFVSGGHICTGDVDFATARSNKDSAHSATAM